MVETTGSTECLVLAKVLDADVRVGAGAVLDEVAENALVVVANDEDLANLLDTCNGSEAVLDDWVTGDFEERLYPVSPCNPPFTCVWIDICTFGRSNESGRKRVPRDGPPTCMYRSVLQALPIQSNAVAIPE